MLLSSISAPEQGHMLYAALLICYWHNLTCNWYPDFWASSVIVDGPSFILRLMWPRISCLFFYCLVLQQLETTTYRSFRSLVTAVYGHCRLILCYKLWNRISHSAAWNIGGSWCWVRACREPGVWTHRLRRIFANKDVVCRCSAVFFLFFSVACDGSVLVFCIAWLGLWRNK